MNILYRGEILSFWNGPMLRMPVCIKPVAYLLLYVKWAGPASVVNLINDWSSSAGKVLSNEWKLLIGKDLIDQ